jgi:High potential iron-sulfur protein
MNHLLPPKASQTLMNQARRLFVLDSALSLGPLCLGSQVFAMAGPVTDEKDPKAVALGYRNDAAKVDTNQYPSYALGQSCGNCAQFKGSPGIAAGPCPQMPKPVLTSGWCSAYVKKG